MADTFRSYGVLAGSREPLIEFIVGALESQGCRVIHRPSAKSAPFRFTFETPEGERLGIVAYAFLANNEPIKNRPPDEHRFQIKYGGDLGGLHHVWQDPYGLYTTLFVGINPDLGFFVAADPLIHSPTRFSVSVEFKDEHVDGITSKKWFAWERERRGGVPHSEKKRTERGVDALGDPLFEVLVGGTAENFLRLVRFEREALGEAAGERHLLADRFFKTVVATTMSHLVAAPAAISRDRLHALATEFELPEQRVLDLIAERRMLKMAVRGSVAEEHLLGVLRSVSGVENCQRLDADSGPDVALSFKGVPLTVECKNSSRVVSAEGYEKIDLQRTRVSKADPCSRYYKPSDFHLVAACTHAVSEKWDFKFAPTRELDEHKTCKGRLSNNVKLDHRWTRDASAALERVVSA